MVSAEVACRQKEGREMSRVWQSIAMLAAVAALCGGCATIQSRWQDAASADSIQAYEAFLSRYPAGQHSAEARSRLEKLCLQEARKTHTVWAYKRFLKRYPAGECAKHAQAGLDDLNRQILEVELAAKKVLPQEAKVEVTSISRFPQKPEFLISAHLLEGHSADEKSPYVRGNYGTHEKLTRLVRYRCARILKSVADESALPDASEITIRACHGVRQVYVGTARRDDVAMTIYQVSLPIETARDKNLAKLAEEDVIELWRVEKNIIPSLQFQTVPF